MRTTLEIAAHHLRRTARTPGLILLLVAVPVTIAAIEYAAFGRAAATGKLPPIKVLFLDEDDTFASGAVPQLFAGGPMKDTFELASVETVDEARGLFKRGEASALVRVPKGFQDALLELRPVEVAFYRNPIQTFSPEIAESFLEMGAAVANGLYAQAREPVLRMQELRDSGRSWTADDVAEIARGFFVAGESFARLDGIEDLSVAVERPDGGAEAEADEPAFDVGKFFATIFPGLVIFGLLFISQALALRLLRDRLRGLQRRLLITPASRLAVLGGGIAYLVVALTALLILLGALGTVVFRIELREPLGLVALGLGFAAFATGMQLAIVGWARSDAGAQAVSGVLILLLALLGGAFVPVESYPPFLKRLGQLLPSGATQQGLVDLLAHGKALAEVGAAVAVVWLWAAVALAAAVLLERRWLVKDA